MGHQLIKMKSQRIKIASVIIGVLVIGFLIQFSADKLNYCVIKPLTESVTVDELLTSFLKNKTIATEQYLNKIIQVRGKVSNVWLLKDNQTMITLKGTRYNSIHCVLNPEKLFGVIDSIEINKEVLIKGKCIGFLNDVYLENCTVFNSSKTKL
jgi:hypothetical protein